MIDRSRKVILLVDYDNLQICASRDTPGRDLQLEPVVQLAQHYGSLLVARAYAEWNLSTERLAVYRSGMEPAFAPVLRTESDRSGKSLADTVMVAEAMDLLWTLQPDVLVLATSDKDLIPLVRVAKQRGTRVVILGSDFTAIPLREMADEHITYKQLITEGASRAAEGATTRQTTIVVEPRSRGREIRERDREIRDREPRETRPAPVAPAVPAAAVQPELVERLAPLTTPDGEGGIAGRRRRRRGSRRRGEPGAVGSEAETGADGTTEGAADVFASSSGTAEEPLTGQEMSRALEDAGSVSEAEPPADTNAPPSVEPEPELAPETAATAPPLLGSAEPEVLSLEPSPAEIESAPPNGVGVGAVADDTVPNGTAEAPTFEPAETGATAVGAEGEPAAAGAETPEPPIRRPRARRVASAARGRSRPADRS